MVKHIRLLVKINLLNRFGFNEARYGKDPKKKKHLISVAAGVILVGFVLIMYSAMLAFGLVSIGMESILPAYVLTLTSLIILVFSILKAGEMIFQMKSYEMLISLPISSAAIVVSRFLNMYIANAILSGLAVMPAMIVYGVMVRPSAGFYVMMLLGVLLLPLIPMIIATSAGAVILAISARMKHKNLVSIVLSLLLVIGLLLVSMLSSGTEATITSTELADITAFLSEQIYNVYPPARLFNEALVYGNVMDFLLYAGISIGGFLVFIWLVQWKFVSICTALRSRTTKNNYEMEELLTSTPLKAFYKKELKGYFSCSLYVLNTIVGYILMVIFAVALAVIGADKMEEQLMMSGIVERIVPLILAAAGSIMATTACSISMEGKNWWIVQSLPVRAKTVFDAKILVNLTIGLPCILISVILVCLSIQTSVLGYLCIVIIPIVYCLFTSVLGITINAKMPMFQWESEATVIKQSGATLLFMLVSFISFGVPIAAVIFLPKQFGHSIMLITACVILFATAFCYKKNNELDIRKIA